PAVGREPGEDAPLVRSGRWLTLVFALMGFTSIGYEVLWFRLLTYFGIHTVYAFAGMLWTYLLGLVLGALIAAKALSRRADRHLVPFARVQLMVAAAAVVSLALIGRSRNLLAIIEGIWQRLGVADVLAEVSAGTSTFLGLCLVVLLLPCTLIGIGL